MGGGTRKSAVEEVILILHLLFHYEGTLNFRLDWRLTDVNDRLGIVASVRRFMNLRRFCFCETIRIFKAALKG